MMHRCLNIVEVQTSIFREVYCQSNGNTTLARLARTCRAFNSAALDSLWATLDSFSHLVQCLPRDLWKTESMSREIIFQRAMLLKDWEIFYRYSSRVRTLDQANTYDRLGRGLVNLSDDVIFVLSNPPNYGPLLPYLKTLYWGKTNRRFAPLLRQLLTPCLNNLSLSSFDSHSPEVSILTCIGTVCPSLKSLHIPLHHTFPGREKILSEALLHLHSLESITCPALDEAAIIHLSHLPRLIDLSLKLQHDFQLEKVRPFLRPPAFASIESLTVHTHTLSTLTSFLEPMSLQPCNVSFVVTVTPTPDALRLFFIALVGACGSEKLTQISLTSTSERRLGLPQQISFSVFQSLLALPNTQQFEFDVPCNIALDDQSITTLAKHWPNLSSLYINVKSGWGITSGVTHKGLVTLLSHCSALSEFALSIDFSLIDVSPLDLPGVRIGNGVSNDECVCANFVTSLITFPIPIAAFLSDVCPDLQEVGSSWAPMMTFGTGMDSDEMEVYRKRWEEVDILLPAFSAVRRQCANWTIKKAQEASDASTVMAA